MSDAELARLRGVVQRVEALAEKWRSEGLSGASAELARALAVPADQPATTDERLAAAEQDARIWHKVATDEGKRVEAVRDALLEGGQSAQIRCQRALAALAAAAEPGTSERPTCEHGYTSLHPVWNATNRAGRCPGPTPDQPATTLHQSWCSLARIAGASCNCRAQAPGPIPHEQGDN